MNVVERLVINTLEVKFEGFPQQNSACDKQERL